MTQTAPDITTRGALRDTGYSPRSVKDELRANAMARLRDGEALFPGVLGYDETVIPQIVHALLARHDLLLLGLRGQAKTRLLRSMVHLLDEWIPVIGADDRHGALIDIPDDPIAPTTLLGRRAVERWGDDLPIAWLHRSQRLHEKLATPDVTIADLIGEIDLVKHAQGRTLADEGTMHFGLLPRSNRGIFVLNELPDLAPRIQVGLFNVLEERDVQIRGYPVRLELDVALMFSANPEDYTNRGRIVTPLKDRIGSVVRTHYPADNELALKITEENAFVAREGGPSVEAPRIMREIIEETIRQARTSAHINQASGVSVRASVAALEALLSGAERRALLAGEDRAVTRIADAAHLPAALRGKLELMLSEEGASGEGRTAEDRLIEALFGEAVKAVVGRLVDLDDVEPIAEAFAGGLRLDVAHEVSGADAVASMRHVPGLLDAADALARRLEMNPGDEQHLACCGELVLEFLYVHNRLSKVTSRTGPGGAYAR